MTAHEPARLLLVLLALGVLPSAACGGASPEVSAPERPAPPATAEPERLEDPEDDSVIEVISGSPTEIKIDGVSVGTTPIRGHRVKPGSHDVTFVFSETDSPTLAVTVGPGETRTVKLDPAPKPKEKDAAEPAKP